MNKKITIGLVLAVSPTAFLIYYNFLGFYLKSFGADASNSFLMGLAYAVVPLILIVLVRNRKQVAKSFKLNVLLEAFLLVLFVITYFVVAPVFTTYFEVRDNKESIQKEAIQHLDEIDLVFTEYEKYTKNRVQDYKDRLGSVLKNRNTNPTQFNAFELNSIKPEEKLNDLVFELENALQPTDSISQKHTKQAWASTMKKNLRSWNVLSLVNEMEAIENTPNEIVAELINVSKYRAPGQATYMNDVDFEYTLNTKADFKSYINKEHKTPILAYVYLLVIYLVMTVYYLAGERDFRYPGWKLLFSKEQDGVGTL